MKILITGSDGFIGKNLRAEMKNRNYKNVFLCNRQTKREQLVEYLKNSDIIVHLAGVNRPEKTEQFNLDNVQFTEFIVDELKKCKSKAKIIFASSIQAELDNLYGRSKRESEKCLMSYSKDMDVPIKIMRYPNIFGKWCKPNYNSVVATFCYNIARDLPIKISDEKRNLKLVYIDDVVDKIIYDIENNIWDELFEDINPVYNISIGSLANLIYKIKNEKTELSVPNLSNGLEKKIYSTYLSYLPLDSFSYNLKMNVDERGSFTELIRSNFAGQVSVNITKPGITKGKHWHHTKTERFIVVKGEALIKFKNIMTNETVNYEVNDKRLEVVNIPPGYVHSITNIGKDNLITVMWANEIFNKEKPDTFAEEI